ncbi:HET-domain-containing protein [Epithele typhae]|uniref:HET-domain-containing protein n=1 Tax=Epithele typhae TaxID=378194 RepID=UPI0020073D01|nr:HET-domain-containing protein [Epithele typhae]KAH9918569.1 HET-domain-containing protein [Epithele typhae]
MWLLHTATAHLRCFNSPEEVPGGYAILSHVWDSPDQEDTFQSVRNLAPATVPRDLLSAKIRDFLVFAETDGHEWAWVDTCCIDKTSSAELTEAINSMFRYYALSSVCYAYLNDVAADTWDRLDTYKNRTGFQLSKWHSRGWTLQELLAPRTVVFFTCDWTPIGTKYELAELLEGTTGIPIAVLRFERGISEMSVAARMSWASQRTTTRVEDETYCLFGLFGINMPTVYGEGRGAFYRFQEELMKRTADTSLFAWGRTMCILKLGEVIPDPRGHDRHAESASDPAHHLFAPAPVYFRGSGNIIFEDRGVSSVSTPHEAHGESFGASDPGAIEVPHFAVTAHGAHATIPIIEITPTFAVADLFCSQDHRPLYLILHRSSTNATVRGCALYTCGLPAFRPFRLPCRLATPRDPLSFLSPTPETTWRMTDVYISSRPSAQSLYRTPELWTRVTHLRDNLSAPFHIRPPVLAAAAATAWNLVDATDLPAAWNGVPPLVLVFEHRAVHNRLSLVLGRCDGRSSALPAPCAGPAAARPHFAFVRFHTWPHRDPLAGVFAHSCGTDHIEGWADGTRAFEGLSWRPGICLSTQDALRVQMKFRRSPLGARGETLDLEFEVGWGEGPRRDIPFMRARIAGSTFSPRGVRAR